MTAPAQRLLAPLLDLKVALILATRLPLPHRGELDGAALARATWALPLAGALVGGLGALAFWGAVGLGLGPAVAAGLVLAIQVLATGCFHEDGLADTADGLGGGRTRERKLEIMRDSRLGSYGATALVLVLLLRFAALTSLAEPGAVALALVASGAAARAPLALVMRLLPAARNDGLAAAAARPPAAGVAVALLLGLAALALCLGWIAGGVAALLLALACLALAWLGLRQIGGYTGDLLGALEQAGEILVLLAALALR